jgi:hypothetical protein
MKLTDDRAQLIHLDGRPLDDIQRTSRGFVRWITRSRKGELRLLRLVVVVRHLELICLFE